MTIKVFTAPRRTPHFEIWQLGSPPVYTVSRRCPPPFLFSNPLFLSHAGTVTFFVFLFPFSCQTYTRIRARRRKTAHLPYTTPRFSILFTSPDLRVAIPMSLAITRSGSANARACRQIGGNWGRRNLSRSVTTLSDIATRGSDVQMLKRTEENMIAR